ncbi:hypothetical protein Mgra_00007916 [Meloidogyne graminicola]|uniref:Uncharacterized protein n=1 Tax=Meloidogyne graminicola TaxID=189291 RepID=A0A8S9ZHE8_9BILA|nr:hypothetical protein Mgra_00007916 [Meloidogyne graminicola]
MSKFIFLLIIFIFIQFCDSVRNKQKNPKQAPSGHLGHQGEGVSMSLTIPKEQRNNQNKPVGPKQVIIALPSFKKGDKVKQKKRITLRANKAKSKNSN